MNEYDIRCLQYVRNTGGNATVAIFDENWEPIGPMVRQRLVPEFMVENGDGKLVLTDAGEAVLEERESGSGSTHRPGGGVVVASSKPVSQHPVR
jgi:hypothetical protein